MAETPPALRDRTVVAAVLSLTAALVWSSYYFFVLALQARGVGILPNIAYPFAAGGVAYLVLAVRNGQAGALRRLSVDGGAYLRVVLLVAMQLLVVVGTYQVGPIDTSLLTLVGDTVLTPVLVLSIFREGTERLRSAAFLAGVAFCTFGAALAIVAGSGTEAVGGIGWIVVVVLPLVIAVYFLWIARLGRTVATEPLLSHSTLVAALGVVVGGLLLPGGAASLGLTDPVDLILLATNGVLSFFIGPWLYFRAIRIVGMILPAVLMSTIPVFTLALGLVLDGSVPPLLGAIGIPLAVVGALLAMRGETAAAASGVGA